MYKLKIDYKTLFDKLSNCSNVINDVVGTSKRVFVKTPSGYSQINGVIRKSKQPIIRVVLDDGNTFECSTGHLFSQNGVPVRAEDSIDIDSLNGVKQVISKIALEEEEVYDIAIDNPHWYLHDSNNTIIHHNTFYTLAACKNFLEMNPTGVVVYFESENALTKDILAGRGIALNRFVHLPVTTVQEFKTQALRIVDEKLSDKEDLPMLFVLDSLGNLSTNKEMEDSASGSDTKDMTRAQIIKAAFRVLALKLGMANIPMVFTNHVYDKIGAGPYAGKEQGGGCLLAGTQIVMADKTLRNIEDVKIGEEVLTLNGNKEVLNCWDETNLIDPNPECYRITFDDGSIVECSENHRFMTGSSWKEVIQLTEGDFVETF